MAGYFGGMIFPGIKLANSSLRDNTDKLGSVDIINTAKIIGNSTEECIQSGLFYSQLFTISESVKLIKSNYFAGEKLTVIGTGGFSHLFKDNKVFDFIVPELTLLGTFYILQFNL